MRTAPPGKFVPDHPKKGHYQSVRVDGWVCMGHKKKGKRWLIHAYAPETGGVLAYVIGKRDTATVNKLYQLLKNIKIDEFCTDQWKAFAHVFKKENHRVGKDLTRHIEGGEQRFEDREQAFCEEDHLFFQEG